MRIDAPHEADEARAVEQLLDRLPGPAPPEQARNSTANEQWEGREAVLRQAALTDRIALRTAGAGPGAAAAASASARRLMALDRVVRSWNCHHGPDHPQWDSVLDPDSTVRAYVRQEYRHHLDSPRPTTRVPGCQGRPDGQAAGPQPRDPGPAGTGARPGARVRTPPLRDSSRPRARSAAGHRRGGVSAEPGPGGSRTPTGLDAGFRTARMTPGSDRMHPAQAPPLCTAGRNARPGRSAGMAAGTGQERPGPGPAGPAGRDGAGRGGRAGTAAR
ncbi:hypothetical protein K353_06123 [Kitasatospora sp. SolWspMP-SS2h]|nr:hypothetical protein K353_06123 [Kitasatospora sp. SolWspMP-SS2h]